MKKILLDVGGTFVKCSDGRSLPINSNGTREEIAFVLREAVHGYDAVSAAVPGPFDYAAGRFLMKHKFASVYGEHFADIAGLDRPGCKFVHDVNCMLLGSNPDRNTALVALGTGLGFALFVDGKLLKNELGSPAVSIFNRPYMDGVLEDYASKRGVLNLYDPSTKLTVKQIASLAQKADPKASGAFATMGTIIADAISPILREYGIERLLLGGQISRSHFLFAPQIRERMPSCVKSVEPVGDFDNATFNGLRIL